MSGESASAIHRNQVHKLELKINSLIQESEEKNLQKELMEVFVNNILLYLQNRRVEAYLKAHNIPHVTIKLEDPGELLLLCTRKHPKLPTNCPDSLAMLSYLVLAGVDFALIHDSHALPDLVPYIQYGSFIAFHGDKGGALQTLMKDKVIDLDEGLEESSSTNLKWGKKIVSGMLANELTTELKNMDLVVKDRSASAMQKMYAETNYEVLSTMLDDHIFFFGERPTSLDALFLGHALFVLHVLPEGSVLFEMLQKYPNLVKYANNHGQEVLHVTPHSMSKIQSLKLCKEFKIHHLHYFTNFDEEQLIGHGSFGKVYKGWMWGSKNPIVSKPIAVKVSENQTPNKLWQFQAEICLCSNLQHRNIVKILGHCKHEEKLYIVYEYMKRGNLGQRYEDLDWPKTIKIARGITLAVEYMHKLDPPLTNRDLKLNNILLDEDLNPKVSDFGMVTEEGVTKFINGTQGFQDGTIKKKGVATRKTDMHNVGVILLLLMTKQPYFDKQDYIGNRAMKQFKEGKDHGIVVHETLKDTGCNEDNSILIIKTALKCIDDCLDARPSIGQVVQILHDL